MSAAGEREDGVGIVVVSHSRALADAAVALATEMLHGREVKIAVAAGLDETTFGTDAVQIKAAIEQVDSTAGVVVLMDLGSALLSAELALDLLSNGTRDRVTLCPAPLVEGLVVATVAAGGGATRDEVAAEAQAALLGKSAQLGSPEPAASTVQVEPGATLATFTVTNVHGLHARPAARLVAEVRRLDASVTIRNVTAGSAPVAASSLSRVATLGALQGHVVEISASGPQARNAVEHLVALADRNFDEPAESAQSDPRTAPELAESTGPLTASPGIGIGPARRLGAAAPRVDESPAGPPTTEWRQLVAAIADVRRAVERARAAAAQKFGVDDAGIFDAHLMLLSDPELLTAAKDRVAAGASAGAAWLASTTQVEQEWAALEDPYLRARAADVHAVAEQVLRALVGDDDASPVVDGVLIAVDLTPAQAASLDAQRVRGVVLAAGSPTSHASILTRSLGIPAVVAAGSAALDVVDGTTVVVDGVTGQVLVAPAADELEHYRREAAALAQRRAVEAADAARPALTSDGVPVVVAANLSSVADARAAVRSGADSAGLIRTELLFLDREQPPSIDEQERDYRAMAEAFGGRPITIRTLDVGGDKSLPYLRLPGEANPYLGRRGIRLSLSQDSLLADQLTAICRVAREFPVNVMFPMVTTLDELLQARQILADAAGPDGVPPSLRVGIMVEVPAVALRLSAFVPHVDFVSIGTNDLTQYTLAAERGNASVASLVDPLDPAVLRLIAEVTRVAAGRITVSVCGEAAADETVVPFLVGLSVTELSVTAPSVPSVKATVRRLDSRTCHELAASALVAASAAEVRALAAELGAAESDGYARAAEMSSDV